MNKVIVVTGASSGSTFLIEIEAMAVVPDRR